jgi:16S rRNA (cytosine1402-N4)-methyltransferase
MSAADVVNTYSEADLANIIYEYGEERKSRAIARAIVTARKEVPIKTTGVLAALIRRVVKTSPKDMTDPCTRTFQALRIYVNRELDELRAGLVAATRVLKTDGRLVVITFHSLEDRIVKQFFQEHAGQAARPSRYLPDTVAAPALYALPDDKVVAVSDAEAARNPRARSAKLRAATRTAVPFTHALSEHPAKGGTR